MSTSPGAAALPAGLGRRVLALAVDWLPAVLVATAFLDVLGAVGPLLVYAVVQVVLVGTLGHSPGHRLLRLHVVETDGGPAGLVRALVRTALILLVVPAVVMDDEGRGLHDRAAGTRVLHLPRNPGRA